MFWTVFFFILLLSGVVTVLAGNAGIVLPLVAIATFYFCMKGTVAKTLPWTVLMAALVDAAWMHRCPGTLLSVLLVTALTALWRKFSDLGSWTSLASAAGWIAVAAWLGEFLAVPAGGLHPVGVWGFMGGFAKQLLWAEIFTPILVFSGERLLGKRLRVDEREAEGDEG